MPIDCVGVTDTREWMMYISQMIYMNDGRSAHSLRRTLLHVLDCLPFKACEDRTRKLYSDTHVSADNLCECVTACESLMHLAQVSYRGLMCVGMVLRWYEATQNRIEGKGKQYDEEDKLTEREKENFVYEDFSKDIYMSSFLF